MAKKMEWHRYLGLFLAKMFKGSGYSVEVDEDFSRNQQLLDILVIRRGDGVPNRTLPDGFDELAYFNLFTFKSFHQSFDGWTVKELVGHYVNCRKQYCLDSKEMRPETDFRLFGICTRFPQKLASELASLGQPLVRRQPGVYDMLWGTDRIRLLVIHELPDTDANAVLNLFAAMRDRVLSARKRYDKSDLGEESTLMYRVLNRYGTEGDEIMKVDIDAFERESKKELIEEWKPELKAEILKEASPAERLVGISIEEFLKGVPEEAIAKFRETLSRMPVR